MQKKVNLRYDVFLAIENTSRRRHYELYMILGVFNQLVEKIAFGAETLSEKVIEIFSDI